VRRPVATEFRAPFYAQQISGLFHAGNVGIIMSGWLEALNEGMTTANDVDSLPLKPKKTTAPA
jgi:hypothetical protein